MPPLTKDDKDWIKTELRAAGSDTRLYVINAIVKAIGQHRDECGARRAFAKFRMSIFVAFIVGVGVAGVLMWLLLDKGM